VYLNGKSIYTERDINFLEKSHGSLEGKLAFAKELATISDDKGNPKFNGFYAWWLWEVNFTYSNK